MTQSVSTKRHRHLPLTAGTKIGRLTLLSFVRENRTSYWICVCDCGSETKTEDSKLKNLKSLSCGCYAIEKSVARLRTHGCTSGGQRHSLYGVWVSMRKRCLSPTNPSYPQYGGRGIGICKQWDAFENFLADMGPKPGPEYSLDRINNDGDYTPKNCRWATWKQQQRNRRCTAHITVSGVSRPLGDWCDEYGISKSLVWNRIFKSGWDPLVALTKAPVRHAERSSFNAA